MSSECIIDVKKSYQLCRQDCRVVKLGTVPRPGKLQSTSDTTAPDPAPVTRNRARVRQSKAIGKTPMPEIRPSIGLAERALLEIGSAAVSACPVAGPRTGGPEQRDRTCRQATNRPVNARQGTTGSLSSGKICRIATFSSKEDPIFSLRRRCPDVQVGPRGHPAGKAGAGSQRL